MLIDEDQPQLGLNHLTAFSIQNTIQMRKLACLSLICFAAACQSPKRTVDYVNPFLGTSGHGHTFPGAATPFGMVQLSPDQYVSGWDWCSGYHNSDSIILGFSHLHLSGTGIGELGDVLLSPQVGALKFTAATRENFQSGYGSRFSHSDEVASVGYYRVYLIDHRVQAEVTASARVGMHRYTFPKSDSASLLVNLHHGIGWDYATDASIHVENDTLITGYRQSSGWANDQCVYFAMTLSKPASTFGTATDSLIFPNQRELKSAKARAYLTFKTSANEPILAKVALSFVSRENALLNLVAEIPHWNFETVKANAEALWEKELAKVHIETLNENDKTTFYTALYHAMLAPMTYSDINGAYRGSQKSNKQLHVVDSARRAYTVFSLWDTFRAWHPLSTILFSERVPDFLHSFLNHFEQFGELPVWLLASSETYCMIGYHAAPVITDAYFKGLLPKNDAEKFFEAMKATAMKDARGLKLYRDYGYIPYNLESESVSKTLEYAFDDACIAAVAAALGKKLESETFGKRARSYQPLLDARIGFMRGKDSSGTWIQTFNPSQAQHWGGTFTEGNSWQYTWFVPHDVEGLIALMGGKEMFVKKLDSLFTVSSNVGKDAPPDVSGLIGQYAHGNEPSHHIPYLYAFAGKPYKTAERVREIMRTFYNHSSAGLCGNEDCGQLSAWYVFSALGFYPVNPSNGVYVFGSPLVKRAMLKLPNGKRLDVRVTNNTEENLYIDSVLRNGVPYTNSFITHSDLMQGGTLEFVMHATPNERFGSGEEDLPKSGWSIR